MSLIRRRLIFQSGERYTCLVSEDGIPDFWTTLFLTTHYRFSSSETMRAVVNTLAHFSVWDGAYKAPFYVRILAIASAVESLPAKQFKEPNFFTVTEAQSLARHCKLTTNAARRNFKKSKKKVVSLTSGLPVTVIPDPVVASKHHRNRLTVISQFLNFFVEVSLRQFPHYAYYLDAAEKMSKLILKQKPKRQGSKNAQTDPDKKAPPPEVFDEIMRIAHPDSSDNPFTKLVSKRNYLVVKLLYETGIRAGELLQLKVRDVDLGGSAISIVRRHDDIEDKWRALEPNAKTLERDIPIPEELTNLLREYIFGERRQMVDRIPKSKGHGFLFVSSKITTGQPLSINQLSNLILKLACDKSLSSYIEAQGIRISKAASPHSYRHNRNNQISMIIDFINEKARREGRLYDVISEKKEKEIRMYLMGHKSEKSAEVYNLRHTKSVAEKLNLKLMEEVSEMMEKAQNSGRFQTDKGEMSLLASQVLRTVSLIQDGKGA
jgi:integrase